MNDKLRQFGATERESHADRFDRIYRTLRERISLITYPPGTVLNEGQLAEEFDASKVPVRRVLQRLSYEGLVTIKNGVGIMVTDLNTQDAKDIYDVRMTLAESMGYSSTLKIDDDTIFDLKLLKEKIQNLRKTDKDIFEFGRVCNSLNDLLVNMIENKVLRELTEILYYRTVRFWSMLSVDPDWEDVLNEVENEIDDYIRSVRIRDARGIGNTRRQYLFVAMERIERHSEVTEK